MGRIEADFWCWTCWGLEVLGMGHVLDGTGSIMASGGRGRDRLAVGDELGESLRSLFDAFFSKRVSFD